MATIFTVGGGSAYLTIVSAAAGSATVQVPNPDLSVTSITLTADQIRSLANAVEAGLVTGAVETPIAGAIVVSTSNSGAVTIAVPLSGTGAGQLYTQSLTPSQAQQLFSSVMLYTVTNQ
jgi:hypothetical protein